MVRQRAKLLDRSCPSESYQATLIKEGFQPLTAGVAISGERYLAPAVNESASGRYLILSQEQITRWEQDSYRCAF